LLGLAWNNLAAREPVAAYLLTAAVGRPAADGN
jgi:hypothetical protein